MFIDIPALCKFCIYIKQIENKHPIENIRKYKISIIFTDIIS